MAQVEITDTKILYKDRYTLKKVSFRQEKADGNTKTQSKEIYDHGNAATVLLYNRQQRTVILTKQFRLATFLNGNSNGELIETCAGLLEKDESAEVTIKREIEEETGYKVTDVKKVFEAYTSAGVLTELLTFFVAEYKPGERTGRGGGLKEEGEDIEVLELDFDEALNMLHTGAIKDAKTIILLQYAQLQQLV